MSPTLPADYARTRSQLQLVATHVLGRARHVATGRFGLRVTPGGFGTPELGDDGRRLRVAAGHLVREHAGARGAGVEAVPLTGSTPASLAAFAGVELTPGFSVGEDTPELGDPGAPLTIGEESEAVVLAWYTTTAAVLDAVVTRYPAADAVMAQLWPEHFDLGLHLEAAPGVRVNLGGSPGDDLLAEPYLYVGPWTADRPGDAAYWNAPFGATRTRASLEREADPIAAALAFLLQGIDHLAG